MAFSYDPATAPGQVRLLAVDTIEASADFSDAEISTFLTLSGGIVLLASALALDRRAALVALIQGKTTVEGISVEAPSLPRSFIARRPSSGDSASRVMTVAVRARS